MKKTLLLFLIVFQSFLGESEELFDFGMVYSECVRYSTHIVRGEIIDEKGRVRISEFWLGQLDSNYLTFKELGSPNEKNDYLPKGELIGWEVILFLRKSSIDGKSNPIKFWAESEATADFTQEDFDMGYSPWLEISMVFVKDDTVYYSMQYENPGDLIFDKRSELTRFKNNIHYDLQHVDWEREIIRLDGKSEIKNYWQTIREADQKYRGKVTVDSIDNANFMKMVLMIKYHGYPSRDSFGNEINKTPNLVFAHQRSEVARRIYFPIFREAFNQGLVDTSEYFWNVKGMHRGMFGRDLIRGRELTVDDLPAFYKNLKFPTNTFAVHYDLSYSLYSFVESQKEIEKITSSKILGQWETERNHIYTIYGDPNWLHIHLKYRDGSEIVPQRITNHRNKNRYRFLKKLPLDDYFEIDSSGNLLVTKEKRDLEYRIQYEQNVDAKGNSTFVERKIFFSKTEICKPLIEPDSGLVRH